MTSVKLKHNIATFPRLRINFWAIPKSGNTTLKYALLRAENRDRFENMLHNHAHHSNDIEQWVHASQTCQYLTPAQAANNGFINLAVIRNPTDRLISGYEDFVNKRPNHRMVGSKSFVQQFQVLRKSPTVEKLLHILEECPNAQRDMHFKTQSSFCSIAKLTYLTLDTISTTIVKCHPDIKVDIKLHTTVKSTKISKTTNDRIREIYQDDEELYHNIAQ